MRDKPSRVWMVLFGGVALLALVSVARLNSAKDLVPWRADFAAASKESALTHKPVFLDFGAQWCDPCQALKSSTWADPSVAAALASYIPVSIDLDANPDLAAQYHADQIPAFVVLDQHGQVQKISIGYLGPDEFLHWLKS